MHQLCQLKGQDLFGLVDPRVLPAGHLVDLLQRQERQHAEALDHIGVAHVAPVLEELIGRGLLRVEPYGVAGCLAHFVSLRVRQQSDGHGVDVFAQLFADELCAAEHIAPLVVSAELHIAAHGLVEMVEVIALHDHVVELEKAQSLLHALLVALCAQHIVHAEVRAHFTQQLHIVQVEKPVGVVHHQGLAVGKIDESLHLTAEAFGVVVDVLPGQHFAHIRPSGGIADHGRTAADQGNRGIARHLQSFHQGQSHEMACGKAVGGAVKTDIELCASVIDKVSDLGLVGNLSDQPALHQFLVDLHCLLSL